MKKVKFSDAWGNEFSSQMEKRNRRVGLIVLIIGTLVILPDVFFSDSYPKDLLWMRIAVSTMGVLGYLVYLTGRVKSLVMVLSYALPMFVLSSYMVALQTDTAGIIQMTSSLGIVGIFYAAFFIIPSSIWILLVSVIFLSYFLSIILAGPFPMAQYISSGGFLVLLGYVTFPFIAQIRDRLFKENFRLRYEVQVQKEELEFYANNDVLTGNFNRRAGLNMLKQMINMAQRHSFPLIISFIDVNHLKMINDKYGHGAGDELIQEISQTAKNCIRKSDVLFRYGGDEFIIIFPGCVEEDCHGVMNKIIKETDSLRMNLSSDHKPSFSYGLAEYKHDQDIEEFIKIADEKMYENKMAQRAAKS